MTPIKIILDPGYILQMHPNLLHSGDCFASANIRAHFYYRYMPNGVFDTNPINNYPTEEFLNEKIQLKSEKVNKVYTLNKARAESQSKKRARADQCRGMTRSREEKRTKR